MAPSRSTYIKIQNRKKALADPMNQALVNKAAPTPALAKGYYDKIASKRNAIADSLKRKNRNISSFDTDAYQKGKVMEAVKQKRKSTADRVLKGYNDTMNDPNGVFGKGFGH